MEGTPMAHRTMIHFNYPNSRKVPEVIDEFVALAMKMDELLEPSPEKDEAFERLLESCDWALRARDLDKANKRYSKVMEDMAERLSLKPSMAGVIPAQHRRS